MMSLLKRRDTSCEVVLQERSVLDSEQTSRFNSQVTGNPQGQRSLLGTVLGLQNKQNSQTPDSGKCYSLDDPVFSKMNCEKNKGDVRKDLRDLLTNVWTLFGL